MTTTIEVEIDTRIIRETEGAVDSKIETRIGEALEAEEGVALMTGVEAEGTLRMRSLSSTPMMRKL